MREGERVEELAPRRLAGRFAIPEMLYLQKLFELTIGPAVEVPSAIGDVSHCPPRSLAHHELCGVRVQLVCRVLEPLTQWGLRKSSEHVGTKLDVFNANFAFGSSSIAFGVYFSVFW